MPALIDIPEALGACCAALGFNQEALITDSINPPAACVQHEEPFIQYLQTMGREALYRFSVTLLYGAMNKDDVQREIAGHLAPDSALVTALESCVDGGVVTVVEARDMGSYEVGAARYFGAKLVVQVRY